MNSVEHSKGTGWPRWPVLLTLLILHHMAAAELTPLPGQRPPPLNLPDLSGQFHDLDDYQGKVVLVNFWASWCSPCLTEMPGMRRLAAAMQDRPFSILAVNSGEKKSQVWRFRKLLGLNFPTLLDHNGKVSHAWQVDTFPTSYIIDTEGRIRYRAIGAVEWDSEALKEKISAMMPAIKR